MPILSVEGVGKVRKRLFDPTLGANDKPRLTAFLDRKFIARIDPPGCPCSACERSPRKST